VKESPKSDSSSMVKQRYPELAALALDETGGGGTVRAFVAPRRSLAPISKLIELVR
jgi:hypothetical protein